MSSGSVSQELFANFISKALENEVTSKPVKQIRHFVDKNNQQIRKKILNFHLRNKLFKNRFVLKNFVSLPYGFTADMLKIAENDKN